MIKLVILTCDPFMNWVFESICEKMPSLLKKKANPNYPLNMPEKKMPMRMPTRSKGNSQTEDHAFVDISNMAQNICSALLEDVLNEVIYMDLHDGFIISTNMMSPARKQICHINPGHEQYRIEAFVHCGVVLLPDMIEQNRRNSKKYGKLKTLQGISQKQHSKSEFTVNEVNDLEVFRLQNMTNIGKTMKERATHILMLLGFNCIPGRLNTGFGNCLFESIIWQIEDLERFKILRRWNSQVETGESWLRQEVITSIYKNKDQLKDYYPHQGERLFEEMVQELSETGGWNNDLADLVVAILPRVVRAPILLIILRDKNEDSLLMKYFPENAIGKTPGKMGLTKDPLVIIYNRNHYEHLLVLNHVDLQACFLDIRWPRIPELRGDFQHPEMNIKSDNETNLREVNPTQKF